MALASLTAALRDRGHILISALILLNNGGCCYIEARLRLPLRGIQRFRIQRSQAAPDSKFKIQGCHLRWDFPPAADSKSSLRGIQRFKEARLRLH